MSRMAEGRPYLRTTILWMLGLLVASCAGPRGPRASRPASTASDRKPNQQVPATAAPRVEPVKGTKESRPKSKQLMMAETPPASKSAADLRNDLAKVGTRLADAAKDEKVAFVFDTLYNPRPRVYHTNDGHIYISNGMFEQLASVDELAAVLALEMAEYLAEQEIDPDLPEAPKLPATGPEDAMRERALAVKLAKGKARPAHEEIPRVASSLLDRAGFDSRKLDAVRGKLQNLAITTSPAEPVPATPEKMSAN